MKMFRRLYTDYLMPPQLGKYEGLLAQARNAGYAQVSVRIFHRQVAHSVACMREALVHRQPIDSDLRAAKKMLVLESRRCVTAS